MTLVSRSLARLAIVALLPALASIPAVAASELAAGVAAWSPDGRLSATVTRTAHGVPHVRADDLESLGFGFGHAFAQDNVCVLADQIVKVNSERSRWFGPDVSPGDGANLESDFGHLALRVLEMAEDGLARLSARAHALLAGYAAGYNAYLAEAGPAGLPPECRGAEWVRPISPRDLLSYHLVLAMEAGSRQFLLPLAGASPPGGASHSGTGPAQQRSGGTGLPDFRDLAIGSNAWALGALRTANGRGALLANPHFPNGGNLKFYEVHLTIPGAMDVAGVALYGLPVVTIGFTRDFAWTHTVSASEKFVLHRLRLVPDDPTSYLFEGRALPLERRPARVVVKQPDGSLSTLERTHYRSRFGPVVAVPGKFDWTAGTAFSLRDPNEGNLNLVEHWLSLNLASSFEEFRDTFRRFAGGAAWVNTLYADRWGNAFYIDGSSVPDLSGAALEALLGDPELAAMHEAAGFPVLPGTDTRFDLPAENGGVVPYERRPKLLRRDFVANANNSHWLVQPAAPLEGFSPLFGPERAPISLRARLGLRMIEEEAGPDGLFDGDELAASLFGNRLMLAELVLPGLRRRCAGTRTGSARLADACAVLGAWDGRADADSRGAHLFREFAHRLPASALGARPFSPRRPVDTPAGLTPPTADGSDPAIEALEQAAAVLETAGIAMDARLADLQFVEKVGPDGQPSSRTSLHGGDNAMGAFNIQQPLRGNDGTLLPQPTADGRPGTAGLGPQGYRIGYGASWISVVTFDEDGPRAEGLLAYSQSSDSNSVHFDDQVRLYAGKTLRKLPFDRAEVDAAAVSTRVLLGTSLRIQE